MKLTIGIPTYNRANYLKSNLDRLLPLVATYQNEVEVLISDNASTDGTKGIIEEFEKEYSFVRKIIKPSNTGSFDNFLNLMRNAHGDYIWLFSDDDIIIEGAIREIINFLNDNPLISIVHLNNYGFKGEFVPENLFGPRLKTTKTFVTRDKNIFLKCAGCHLTFLTTTIFNRQLLHNAWDVLVRDTDTYFLQVYAAFLSTAKDDVEMGYISFPCVAARANDRVNYNLYEVLLNIYIVR